MWEIRGRGSSEGQERRGGVGGRPRGRSRYLEGMLVGGTSEGILRSLLRYGVGKSITHRTMVFVCNDLFSLKSENSINLDPSPGAM